MICGAIFGDIAGSIYEGNNIKTKDFELFDEKSFFTDDTVMTIAVGAALRKCAGNYDKLDDIVAATMRFLGRKYPYAGYGLSFMQWLLHDDAKPYNSYGNGAAMRISAAAYYAESINEVKDLSYKITAVSHNHPEGIKGAEATSVAIFLAIHGNDKEEIKKHIVQNYYPIDFSLDEIRPTYRFNETCQDTVPQALEAFFESTDFEDAVRNAVSIGGDSDTLASITGGVAEAYYGVSERVKDFVFDKLHKDLQLFYTYVEEGNHK